MSAITWHDIIALIILAFIAWLLAGAWRETTKKYDPVRQKAIEDSVVELFQFAKKVQRYAEDQAAPKLHGMATEVICNVFERMRMDKNGNIEL